MALQLKYCCCYSQVDTCTWLELEGCLCLANCYLRRGKIQALSSSVLYSHLRLWPAGFQESFSETSFIQKMTWKPGKSLRQQQTPWGSRNQSGGKECFIEVEMKWSKRNISQQWIHTNCFQHVHASLVNPSPRGSQWQAPQDRKWQYWPESSNMITGKRSTEHLHKFFHVLLPLATMEKV